jgi:hypothetical protein
MNSSRITKSVVYVPHSQATRTVVRKNGELAKYGIEIAKV